MRQSCTNHQAKAQSEQRRAGLEEDQNGNYEAQAERTVEVLRYGPGFARAIEPGGERFGA